MNIDPIAQIIKENKPELSEAFTEKTMRLLKERLVQKMRMRLYLLILFIILFLASTFILLTLSGFKVLALGLTIKLPRIFTMLLVSVVCYFAILHLTKLMKFGLGKLNFT